MESAFDRDQHITIVKENVKPKYMNNFRKISKDQMNYFGTSYDLDSIMHVNDKAYSKNGEITIKTVDPKLQHKIKELKSKLSPGDVKRINNMYKCRTSR